MTDHLPPIEREVPTAEEDLHAPAHASVSTYLLIGVILTAVTGFEIAAVYVKFFRPVLVPLLLVLSAIKFSLVVLFFMHLRYDRKTLSVLFVGPLTIAIALVIALMTLPGAFLLFSR